MFSKIKENKATKCKENSEEMYKPHFATTLCWERSQENRILSKFDFYDVLQKAVTTARASTYSTHLIVLHLRLKQGLLNFVCHTLYIIQY